MSLHKKPFYNRPEIRNALVAHHMEVDEPSQVSDAFRLGFVAGQNTCEPSAELEAQSVKVKPLVWEYPEHHQDVELAETLFGSYSVWEIGGEGYLKKPEQVSGFFSGGDLKHAKAAAQADYERRVLGALELE